MTKVNRNEKIWAYAGGGTKAHAFIELDDPAVPDVFRAMCRESLKHTGKSTLVGQRSMKDDLCRNCLNRAEAMWWSVETFGEIQDAAVKTPAPVPTDTEADEMTDAEFLAYNAERARLLITSGAKDDFEAEVLVTGFVEMFPALAEAIGVAAVNDTLPEVGSRSSRAGKRHINGYPETYTMMATVLGIISPYTDIWTGQKQAHGVRFRIDEMSSGDVRTSFHSLSLDDFRTHWVDQPDA